MNRLFSESGWMVHRVDDFGRLTEVWGPSELAEDGEDAVPVGCTPSKLWSAEEPAGEGEPTIGFEYALQPGQTAALPAWAKTSHKDVERPGDPIVTVTFADGLGRVLQTKKDHERDTGTSTELGMTVSGAMRSVAWWSKGSRVSARRRIQPS
jgi:hypothetical protein